VGNGESVSLQNYVNEKGISKEVILTGYLPDVSEVFLQSHCLLNCARFEAFGRTTVEAMAYSLPVIGNNTAGTAEIIQHNHTGLLYNGSTDELVSCMKALLKDPVFARQLGNNAWHDAIEKYNIELYVDNFLAFLKKEVTLQKD
jgi:glycosyltransferase involved in cell wall biosynthesis